MNGTTVLSSQPISGAADWTRFEVSYTNTTNADQPLNAALICGSSDTVYLDCVQVENAPTASRYNLMENGDFRFSGSPAQYWTASNLADGDGSVTLEDSAAPQLDGNVIQITGSSVNVRRISQTLDISGNKGDSYIISGWAKADSVPLESQSDTRSRMFGIKISFVNTDDSKTSVTANFNPAINSDDGWQYTAAAAVAKQAFDSILVEVFYAYNGNTAYFDGIQLYKEEFSQSYTYDDDGNIVSVIDLQKKNTTYEYENNDLTKVTMPDGAVYEYTYDDKHNVKTAKPATGLTYHFTYDEFGNNTSVYIEFQGEAVNIGGISGSTISREILGATATYSTDGNRLISTTDTTGNVTTYSYNEQNNELEWVKYPEDSDTTKTVYDYDDLYRMTEATTTTDTGSLLKAEYTYENDLLKTLKTSSTTYTFNYGDFALRSDIKIGSRTLASYEYTDKTNAAGELDYAEERDYYLKKLAYGNGDSVKYTYDDQGRVTKQTYEDNSTVEYRYDNDGVLATITDSATGRTTTYYYDFIDRMMKYDIIKKNKN